MTADDRISETNSSSPDGDLPAKSSDPPTPASNKVPLSNPVDESELSETVESQRAAASLKQIGKFIKLGNLGSGAFGTVFLCEDPVAGRKVAVKVVDESKLPGRSSKEYAAEAMALGKLDHPRIVPLYEANRAPDGQFYVVSKYIPGGDLRRQIKNRDFWTNGVVAKVIADLADALDHAHKRGIVHRDVKPANILMDLEGQVYLADFGIAKQDTIPESQAAMVGTVPYMSPEQAGGESHRVDGRSDIFSLGAVFYEILEGKRLFPGTNKRELIGNILSFDPDDLGTLESQPPAGLEQILRRMLARLSVDRFPTAGHVANEIRDWMNAQENGETLPQILRTGTQSPEPTGPLAADASAIGARGLRPFQAADASVFLDLLPGARDRKGVPEIVSFWLDRIDPDRVDATAEPLAVGVIYGPSGSGKSSLAAAGILPILKGHVRVLNVECAPGDTALRILKSLARMEESTISDSSISSDAGSLPESFARIRRGTSKKSQRFLLVLDQFEQWLRTWNGNPDDPLVLALRQCDGVKLQALIIVRDDFWSSTNRLLHLLEQPFSEGKTATNISGFSPKHARRVLERFGRAHGAIETLVGSSGGSSTTTSGESERFVKTVVEQLTTDGTVLPVRLALFVETVKEMPWTMATLRKIGGVEGAARYFLDATFGPNAPVGQRRHRKPALKVLEALLPDDAAVDIKGAQQDFQTLREKTGYSDPVDANDLFDLLENRLRLITVVESEDKITLDSSFNVVPETSTRTSPNFNYQLTHDYLVRPLRAWIDHDQTQSLRGRLEKRIDQLAKAYAIAPEARNLPPWWQWPAMSLTYVAAHHDFKTLTRKRMMHASNRRFGFTFAIAAFFLISASWAISEIRGAEKANTVVDSLVQCESEAVPVIIPRLKPLRRWADPILRGLAQLPIGESSTPDDRRRTFRSQLGLLESQSEFVVPVVKRIPSCSIAEVLSTRQVLEAQRPLAVSAVWEAIDSEPDKSRCIPYACALATLDPENARWKTLADELAMTLCSQTPTFSRQWIDLLAIKHSELVIPLERIAREKADSPAGETAAMLLSVSLAEQPQRLLELALSSNGRQLRYFIEELKTRRAEATKTLIAACEHRADFCDQEATIAIGSRRANAALVMAGLGNFAGLHSIAADAVDPTARSKFARRFVESGADIKLLIDGIDDRNRHVDLRFAMLVALVPVVAKGLEPTLVRCIADKALALYDSDPDSGIHAVCGLILRKLNRNAAVLKLNLKHQKEGARQHCNWFVAPDGSVMVVVEPMKVPLSVPIFERNKLRGFKELQNKHRFAIGMFEISAGQMRQYFAKEMDRQSMVVPLDHPARYLDPPILFGYPEKINEAIALSESQRPLPNVKQLFVGQFNPPNKDLSKVTGFRLATELEWEIACRANSRTIWSFGNDPSDAESFAKFKGTPGLETLPCGSLIPNRLGIFDMHGNVMEYTMPDPWKLKRPGGPFEVTFRGGHFDALVLSTTSAKFQKTILECGDGATNFLSGIRIAASIATEFNAAKNGP